MATTPDTSFLRVELKNQRPVELIDLTASLLALGQAYEEFAANHGFDPIRGNVKLYIQELRMGSIVADLKAMLDQASFLLDHRDLYAAFLANFNDLMQWFLTGRVPASPDNKPGRVEVERLNQILEPVAKDGGAQIFLQVQGDLHVTTQYHYDSQEANTVQNRIRKYLGPSLPGTQFFQHEPMTLFQVRDDPRGKVGDRGYITKFGSKPVKLHFMNEEAKRLVLEQPYPLRKIFFVDGEVGMAGDKPAVYKIQYVHGSEESAED